MARGLGFHHSHGFSDEAAIDETVVVGKGHQKFPARLIHGETEIVHHVMIAGLPIKPQLKPVILGQCEFADHRLQRRGGAVVQNDDSSGR